TLTVTGAFTLQASATLSEDIDFTSNTADQVLLSQGGNVTLAGNLNLQFLNLSGNVTVPRTFVLVHIDNNKTGTVSGLFANITPVANTALAFAVSYNYAADSDNVGNDVAITFTSVP